MVKLSPPDPRRALPSRADPHERSRRKELEKKHPFSLKEPLVLGLIGVGLIWNIEHQVEKAEKRKEEEEQRRRRGVWQDRGREDSERREGRRSRSRRRRDEEGSRDYRDGISRERYHRDGEADRDRDLESGVGRRIGYERPREYAGYRDQFRDLVNDDRYEARREGSAKRSSRRDSF